MRQDPATAAILSALHGSRTSARERQTGTGLGWVGLGLVLRLMGFSVLLNVSVSRLCVFTGCVCVLFWGLLGRACLTH